jgi:prepilin-type N-terminal cleavage/methylation domain-containing protein
LKGGIIPMKRTENNKGFTIIEVVLVLAIAGLIFLMVFIALPALQAGQRDTARKSDVSNVAAAVNSFTSNNRGTTPTTANLATQLGTNVSNNTVKVLVNGTSGAQTIAAEAGSATNNTAASRVQDGLVVVTFGTKCGTSSTTQTLTAGSARQYTTVTKLEGGAGNAFCLDS